MSTVIDPQNQTHVRVVTTTDALAEIAGEWNRLAGENPFRRWEWLEAAWRHYHSREESLFVICVHNSLGDLLGILPLTRRNTASNGCVLRLIGSSELCSEYLGILAREENRDAVVHETARWLTEEAEAWDLLRLDDVDLSDPAIAQLITLLVEFGHQADRREAVRCWRAPLPDSWDGYLKLLSRSRRERVRRLVRRNFDTGRAVRHVARSVDDLDRGFEILCRLHQLRWTSVGKPGIFATSTAREFHREVMQRFLAAGMLHLAWIDLDGEPVSAEYCLAGGSTMHYYQGGIDPARSDEDPGWLQFIASIHAAIDGGFTTYDFLRGDEPYKASWRAAPLILHEVRIVGHTPFAQARQNAWRYKTAAKGWIKRRLPRSQP